MSTDYGQEPYPAPLSGLVAAYSNTRGGRYSQALCEQNAEAAEAALTALQLDAVGDFLAELLREMPEDGVLTKAEVQAWSNAIEDSYTELGLRGEEVSE